MRRDGQSDAIALTQTIALVQASEGAGYIVVGDEIDTKDWDEVAIIVEPSRAIAAGDDLRLVVQESETTGGTFTAIGADQKLPTYKSADNFKVYEPTSPYAQVFGFIGAKRFVKIGFNGVTIDTSDVSLVCTIIAKPGQRPAYAFVDPNAPTDGLP